jgi:hypothetical protein
MRNRDVIRDIRGFAAARRVRVTSHGRRRMSERGVTYADLRHGLMNADDCEEGANGRWKVCTSDMSGDPLNVILFIQDGLLIVTVF